MNDTPKTDMGDPREQQGWATAKTLAEALPYIQRYDREIVVIKYGGHAMGQEDVAKQFAADAVLLKLLGLHPVVVHGGGPQISAMLERAGVKSTFVDGLRVTDAPTMEVAEMVLSGAINKEIANWITLAGAEADVRGVGRTGKAPGSKLEEAVDLGFVGEPTRVDPKLILDLINSTDDYVPVIAPIGVSVEGETYNINADTVAGALAGALKAKRLLLLTDIQGVIGPDGDLIRQMTVREAGKAVATGIATGGMIPKLETAVAAVEAGVESAVILDGRRPHAMLVELFTGHGAGTLGRAAPASPSPTCSPRSKPAGSGARRSRRRRAARCGRRWRRPSRS